MRQNMKLVIFEADLYPNFFPLTYPRPVFALRCGATSLATTVKGEKAAFEGGSIAWLITLSDDEVAAIRSYADLKRVAEKTPAAPNKCPAKCFRWMWELMLDSPHVIADDFRAAGQAGIHGELRPDVAVYGERSQLAIAG